MFGSHSPDCIPTLQTLRPTMMTHDGSETNSTNLPWNRSVQVQIKDGSKDGSMINDGSMTLAYTTATDTSVAAPSLSLLSEESRHLPVKGLTLASEGILASELANDACPHINCQPLNCQAIPTLASVATKWLTIDVLTHISLERRPWMFGKKSFRIHRNSLSDMLLIIQEQNFSVMLHKHPEPSECTYAKKIEWWKNLTRSQVTNTCQRNMWVAACHGRWSQYLDSEADWIVSKFHTFP